jgi:Cdc6-like AAA superfamily ATPase
MLGINILGISLIIITLGGVLVTLRHFVKKIYLDNPFKYHGRITDAHHFFGRAALLQDIFENLTRGQNIFLFGEKGIGKSSILSMVCKHIYEQTISHHHAETFVYLDMQYINNQEEFFDALCIELGIPLCLPYELVRLLEGKHYIVCLDHIEKIAHTRFSRIAIVLRGLANSPNAPLTLVIASCLSAHKLAQVSKEMSPLINTCHLIEIPPFSLEEIRHFTELRLQSNEIKFTETDIQFLWKETQGHPRRLQKVAAELYQRRHFSRKLW